MNLENFKRLFVYDGWANGEVLRSLRAAGTPPARALERFAHVLSAEGLWLSRLRHQPAPHPVWPQLNLAQCEGEVAKLSSLWTEYLDGVQKNGAAGAVTYKNSAGETWTSQVEEILMHVIMHSAYHRGQIAADLRAAGFSPAHTDFIHGVRQGFVK